MARAVEQIERDIAALEEGCRAIAVQLYSVYKTYLTDLGQAIQQQLILAGYHLCTQGYPEAFVKLSFNQRQQLQQVLRNLGKRASEQLLVEINNENLGASSTHQLPLNPVELVQWQQNLEEAIADTLTKVSHDTNIEVQQAGILPQKLPLAALMEVAANSPEASAQITAGLPNTLNLVLQAEENEQESENTNVTHIIAIYLRLGEIELTDAKVRVGRTQIRNLLLQINKLGQEYQKKQQELIVAEAEAAWRASWFEE